jgi:hypothetical protein
MLTADLVGAGRSHPVSSVANVHRGEPFEPAHGARGP